MEIESENFWNSNNFLEIKTMVNMQHKNIVRFITSWLEQRVDTEIDNYVPYSYEYQNSSSSLNNFEITFENTNKKVEKKFKFDHSRPKQFVDLYIQMEYCNGKALNQYLLNRKIKFKEQIVYFIILQLIDGLSYMHSKGIIHLDLKPGNIFIHNGEVKIGDFGLSTINQEKKVFTVLEFEDFKNRNKILDDSFIKGTPFYNAPETEKFEYSPKSDVFSLGVIFFELLSNFRTNFEKIKQFTELRKKLRVPLSFEEEFPLPSIMINKMINKDKNQRPQSNEIFEMVIFKNWEMKVNKSFI